jgi:hypothetical protein
MISELELVANKIVGGEKVKVIPYKVNSVHIHQIGEVAGLAQLGLVKSDSNNASNFFIAQDSQNLQLAWSQIKREWARAKKFRGLTAPAIEKTFNILELSDNEVMRTVNTKARRIVQALQTLMVKMVYSQSARTAYGLSDGDIASFERQMVYIEEIINDYAGTGAEKEDGSADTGLLLPDYSYLGEIKPPLNLWGVTSSETSPAAPLNVPEGDAPDSASTVPSPNDTVVSNAAK